MVRKTPGGVDGAVVEEHDAQQHDQVRVAVHHRVEEGPEGAHAVGEPRQGAVEEVEEPGQREQHRAHPQAPLGQRAGGEDADPEPDHVR